MASFDYYAARPVAYIRLVLRYGSIQLLGTLSVSTTSIWLLTLAAGFVSYDDPDHAELAMSRMDGFFIGQKRLKVVQKRGEERVFDTSRTVNNTKHGIPPFDGSKNGDRIISSGSSSGGFYVFGYDALDFGWCSGGDASGQSDLQDGESLSDAFDRVTPESLLGLSMAR